MKPIYPVHCKSPDFRLHRREPSVPALLVKQDMRVRGESKQPVPLGHTQILEAIPALLVAQGPTVQ
jgi:hypothetical protein